MQKYIISALIFTLTSVTFASDLDPYWYQLPENEVVQNTNTEKGFFSQKRFEKKIQKITGAELNALEKLKEKEGKWHLDGVNTTLALGLSGNIGVLSWGGTKAIELFWHNKKAQKSEAAEKALQTIYFDEEMKAQDLQNDVDTIVSSLIASGKVKESDDLRKKLHKKTNDFFKMVEAVASVKNTKWVPSKLRLDFVISAEGKIGGVVLAKVGGDIRLRFEWSRKARTVYQKTNVVLDKTQESIKRLISTFSSEIANADIDKVEKHNFSLSYVRLGLAVGVKGSVGILKGSMGFAPYIYLVPNKEKSSTPVVATDIQDGLPLIVNLQTTEHLDYAAKNNLQYDKKATYPIFKISNKKFKKGMNKAVRFAANTAKYVEKRDGKKTKWGIKKIRSSFAFSVSGDVGVVSLKGTPSIELEFKNNNF